MDPATLAEARQHLATLPLDTIPDPTMDLPFSSRVPLDRNTLFVGREAELRTLARILKGGATAAIGQVAAATGLGGIGKTQLASEFVYRYGQYFDGGVYWLSFAVPAAIPSEVALCGGAGHLELRPDFTNLSLEEQIESVLAAWQSPMPRLLVFDNCEDERLLACWRPRGGGSRVLLTSRRGQWPRVLNVSALRLGVLARNESIELLRMHRPDPSTENASLNAIANQVGDLPLALHLSGSFLETFQHAKLGTPESYLEQLSQVPVLHHPALEGEGSTPSPTDHEQHVYRTFALSYQLLDAGDPTDALAIALLARAAYFAPGEIIPRDLLLAALQRNVTDLVQTLQDEKALGRLVALGLLEEQASGALLMHRLVTAFAREASRDATAQPSVEQALLGTAGDLLDAGYPEPLVELLPHLRAVTDAAKEREDERAASLCNQLGACLSMTGAYTEARPLFERALAIYEKVLGEEHPDTAGGLNDLAILLDDQGSYQEARPLFERALAIFEKLYGEDHPNTALSLNNLANLLSKQGSYEEARPLYERALAIRQKVLGEDHPETASTLNNLANLLKEQGSYEEARPLFERALAIFEKVLEEDHPNIAQSLNNLAILLYEQGSYQEARPLFERALAIYEKVLGEEHPDTATTLNNLALLLSDEGSYEEARRLYERALAIRQKVYGEEHRDTATTLNNLALLLSDEGSYEEARRLYERALAIRQKVLGEDHPDTAQSLNNLAILLYEQGSYQEARPLFERALAIYEKVLGEEHPDTAQSLNNLANLLANQGSYQEARPLYVRALAIYEKVLGEDHPNTMRVRQNLTTLDT